MFTMLITCAVLAAPNTFVASQSGVLLVPPCRDVSGDLIPAFSYSDFISRGMKFLLEEQATWFQGPPVTDESGHSLPPYFGHAKLRPDGAVYLEPVAGRGVVYPAFHHAVAIETFLSYYVYSGDPEALRKARELADWNIAHSTPLDWLYGGMPYSTFTNGVAGGYVDGDAIMTDKPAIMALAYLRLHRATGDTLYHTAAKRIADVLVKHQGDDGSWPFRVNPKTGEVRESYSSSAIYAVMLFDALDAADPGSPYHEPRARALRWVLENPVRTLDWRGFYEDVGNAPENRTNFDCIDTACYLIAHAEEIPNAITLAKKLDAWIEETFVDREHAYAPAPGVYEQKVCFNLMGVHGMHWAMMAADLYRLTGNPAHKRDVVQVMNYLTYHLQPDNRIIVGPGHGITLPEGAPFWYSCHLGPMWYLLEALGKLPELAPAGETHILKTTGGVREIAYGDGTVIYTANEAGTTTLKLAFNPKVVTADGRPPVAGAWTYDAEQHVGVLVHEAGKVVIH